MTDMSNMSLINGLQGMPAHARMINEDKITAPSGREIFTPSRRVRPELCPALRSTNSLPLSTQMSTKQGYSARGGAGNALKASKANKNQQETTANQLMAHEREVLQKHKAQATPDFKTGRGGLGAKGHVKKRGLVPNHEAAIAKEAEVRERWNEYKEATGAGARFGRGGYNVRKSDKGDAKSTSSGSKSRSGSGREAQQELFPPFAVSENERKRRRRFSYTHASTVRSSSYRQSNASQDTWDRVSTSDSIYDIAATTGITTSTINPATVLDIISARPLSPQLSSPRNLTFQDTQGRAPNEVAPFDEPLVPPSSSTPSVDPSMQAAKAPKKKQSTSILRSLKGLSLGKPKEGKAGNPPFPSRPPNPFYSSNDPTLYPPRSPSAASFALSMVNSSHRDLSRTPMDVAPRVPSVSREGIASRMSSTHASTSAASSMTSAYHYPPRIPHPYASASVVTISTMVSTTNESHSMSAPVASKPQSEQPTLAASAVSSHPQPSTLSMPPTSQFPKPTTQKRPYRPLPTPPTVPPATTSGLPSPPTTP